MSKCHIFGNLMHWLIYISISDEDLFYMKASESAASLRAELGETSSDDSFHREVIIEHKFMSPSQGFWGTLQHRPNC